MARKRQAKVFKCTTYLCKAHALIGFKPQDTCYISAYSKKDALDGMQKVFPPSESKAPKMVTQVYYITPDYTYYDGELISLYPKPSDALKIEERTDD